MVPGKGTVLSAAAGEGEPGPYTNCLRFPDGLIPVFRRDRYGSHIFHFIAADLLVQNDVCEDFYSGIMKRPDGLGVFFGSSVLCAYGPFLVKFPEIIHIIYTVTDIVLAGCLVCRGKPDPCDPEICEILCFRRTALPPETVIGKIPFKKLHHCFVGHL